MRKHPKDSSSSPSHSTSSSPIQQSSATLPSTNQESMSSRHAQQGTGVAQAGFAGASSGAYSAADHPSHHSSYAQPQQQQQQHKPEAKDYPYGEKQAEFDTTDGKKERLPVYAGLEAFQLVEKMGE